MDGWRLLVGAFDLVRRANPVMATGNTESPPRETHPEKPDRIARIGLCDDLAPPEAREQMVAIWSDLFDILDYVWKAVLPLFRGLHHEVGVRVERNDAKKFA